MFTPNMNIFTCCCPCQTTYHAGASFELILLLSQALLQYGPVDPAQVPPVHSDEGQERQMSCMVPRAAPATGFSPL